MSVRENIYITDATPGWFQGAAAVQGFVWCVQNGAIVAGSATVPMVQPVLRTGNDISDMADYLTAIFADLTGDIPAGTPIVDSPATFVNGWGVAGLTATGPGGQRVGIYLWAGVTYDFGLLNLPPQNAETDARDWFVRFEAQVFAAETVPAWSTITNYITAKGANPILHVAELKSIE